MDDSQMFQGRNGVGGMRCWKKLWDKFSNKIEVHIKKYEIADSVQMLHTSIHIPCYAKNDKAQYTILFGLEISKLHRQSWPRTWPKTRQHKKKTPCTIKSTSVMDACWVPAAASWSSLKMVEWFTWWNLHVTRESHWLWLMGLFVGKDPKRRLFCRKNSEGYTANQVGPNGCF